MKPRRRPQPARRNMLRSPAQPGIQNSEATQRPSRPTAHRLIDCHPDADDEVLRHRQCLQSQDVNGQWTTYTYGNCGNSFLTNISMPLSLSKSLSWNCTGGVMTSSTNENGNISYINYTTDPYFWRPESTKDPLLYVTNLSYPA